MRAIRKFIAGRLLHNGDLSRLALHSALQQLAWSLLSAFSAVFLFRQGLAVADIFLCFAAIITLRCAVRPAVFLSVRALGLRATLMVGTLLYAIQSPLLALVHGLDLALLAYSIAAAMAQAFYWTSYHAIFAAVGEAEDRGRQVGWREFLMTIAGMAGPAAGGVMLTVGGPWLAFGTAAVVECIAILPLRHVKDPPIVPVAPGGSFRRQRRGMLLLGTDGWIFTLSAWSWSLIMFQALHDRYDVFGGSLAGLALAGALSGLVLGRFIDMGHARRAVWINTVTLAATLIAKAVCSTDAVPVLALAFGTTAFGGLYVPSLMTALYNEAKASGCPFRFHVAAEMGWDIGATLACLSAAALSAFGFSLQTLIALALPVAVFQAFVLDESYAVRKSAVTVLRTELSVR